MSIVFCGTLILLGSILQAQRGQDETWVNPGVGPGAPTDLPTFVRSTDAGFVGVLEQVSVSFIDREQQWLFTSMRFRVSEWLYNGKPTASVVDVLTIGGSFVQGGGQRTAKHPSDIADHLRKGSEYFVPIRYAKDASRPWYGSPMLAAVDALTELRDGRVLTVLPHARWAENVLAHTPTAQRAPGAPDSDRERFIAAMRAAGAAK
jgi:hypothetical protein